MPDLMEVSNSGGLTGLANTSLGAIADVLKTKYNAEATAAGYRDSATLAANAANIQTQAQQQNMLYFGIGALLLLGAFVIVKVR